MLNVANACNMACSYCFALGGNYGEPQELMSPEIARSAIDFALETEDADIHFYGGEPLLNTQVIVDALEYISFRTRNTRRKIRIFVSTNGTLSIDDICGNLRPFPFQINVSLDGPSEVQNRNRPLQNGDGSSSVVGANIKKWLRLFGPDRVTTKITFTYEKGDLIPLVDTSIDLGVKNILITPVLPHEMTEPQTKGYYRQQLVKYRELLEWYFEKIKRNPGLQIQPFHKLSKLLYTSTNSAQYCMAGIRLFCIFPDGRIYPCHRLAGKSNFLLGNVLDNLYRLEHALEIVQYPAQAEVRCRECWIRHLCGGNKCPAQNMILGQPLDSINSPYLCWLQKQVIILIAFHLSTLNPRLRERAFGSPYR